MIARCRPAVNLIVPGIGCAPGCWPPGPSGPPSRTSRPVTVPRAGSRPEPAAVCWPEPAAHAASSGRAARQLTARASFTSPPGGSAVRLDGLAAIMVPPSRIPGARCTAGSRYQIMHSVAKTDKAAMAETPVLVAGGGPAGLAAAAELALHGVACVVIEPRTVVSHRRPRAKTTSVRTMEHLRRWGIADTLRAAAPLPVAWSQRVTFCESLSGRRITDFDNAFGLATAPDDRFAESGQQVPQPVVEEVLRAHLRGHDLRLGVSVTELRQLQDRVEVQLSDGSTVDA